MSRFAALALYPLWAVALLLGLTALRLGRSVGRGLVSLCLLFAVWVTGLILFASPATTVVAERVLPAGILLAAAFVHAAADVARLERRRVVVVAYAACIAVTALGLGAPRLLYGPGARGAGPLMLPVAAVATSASAALLVWLVMLARAAKGAERRRRGALAAACVLGSLGGGGAIAAHVARIADVEVAAPLLLAALVVAAYAVLGAERGRFRTLVAQGLVQSLVTAALSAVGLVAFFLALPALTPDGGGSVAWLVFVTFFAALPLEPLRMLVVERIGRAVFSSPIGVRDLAEEVERTEARADHAERLAEIGVMASAVAHEIRNPLGVIAAQTKVLERAGANPATVAALRAQVDRSKRFLDDLLRYSKPRPLEIALVEVQPVVALAVGEVRQAMGDDAPPVDSVVEPGLELEVDRGAFHDVATVLVHNACIAAAGGAVRVAARRVGDDVLLSVDDDGPGVPEAIEATLFAPFVTGRGRDAKHPGTGLGLAIAARWVERHGGRLTHERPEGGGARFVARWPRRPRPEGRPTGSSG